MTDRERLIELVDKAKEEYANDITDHTETDYIVECLLNNGVIVPPCKVGDKTFLLLEKRSGGYDIVESKCVRITDNGYGKYYSMAIDCPEIGNTLEFGIYDFGKFVFPTREEAEEKLKEREKV